MSPRRTLALAVAAVALAVGAPSSIAGRTPTPPLDYPEALFAPVTLSAEPTPYPRTDDAARRPRASSAPLRAGPTQPPVAVPTPELIVVGLTPSVADAKAYALARLGSTQYACLANIVYYEDRTWDPTPPRQSPYSGPYGIPQSVPGTKMAWAGSDWLTNPITQIKWMIHYVDGRYGSACGAWAFKQRTGWY